ncbi:hypothetical protein FE697_004130 [Mumia zhuanghuii]|uniref:Uncharacterized protein n=2 Tax=Mumia TaxID=1546255 RepID=A0ABW1QQ48_9ACTN|nr:MULTISPECIES: hypothetical protein [Mumia]KAA1425077.1 hypothetical protein FE697_004130 [Mumia zhuanghuii]
MSRSRLGLPVWAIVALAALALPRVVVHDLGVDVGALVNAVLALAPPAVWVVVVLRARVPSPVTTLVVVGAVYGIGLGIGHNLMWDSAFEDSPSLGGSLDGDLSDGTEEAVMRSATFASSLFTGAVVGLVAGLVASGLRRLGRSDGARR